MTHPLARHHATAHQASAIRSSMMAAPEDLRRRGEAAGAAAAGDTTHPVPRGEAVGPAQVLALPNRGPRRDGVTRLGVIVPLDNSNRASVKKLISHLGWSPAQPLVATITGATAVVRPGKRTRTEPWLSPVQLDAGGRLTVPPAVKAALQLNAGDQIVVCAIQESGVLHLAAGADLLQQLSGDLPRPVAPTAAATSVTPAPRTRVRRAVRIAD